MIIECKLLQPKVVKRLIFNFLIELFGNLWFVFHELKNVFFLTYQVFVEFFEIQFFGYICSTLRLTELFIVNLHFQIDAKFVILVPEYSDVVLKHPYWDYFAFNVNVMFFNTLVNFFSESMQDWGDGVEI